MDFHSHARRFFNHLFDSELGLRVHHQAGDLIHNWDIIYSRVKLVTLFSQRFNNGHFLSLLFKLLFLFIHDVCAMHFGAFHKLTSILKNNSIC